MVASVPLACMGQSTHVGQHVLVNIQSKSTLYPSSLRGSPTAPEKHKLKRHKLKKHFHFSILMNTRQVCEAIFTTHIPAKIDSTALQEGCQVAQKHWLRQQAVQRIGPLHRRHQGDQLHGTAAAHAAGQCTRRPLMHRQTTWPVLLAPNDREDGSSKYNPFVCCSQTAVDINTDTWSNSGQHKPRHSVKQRST